jgi:sugar (pentulose or hexulose) kinase
VSTQPPTRAELVLAALDGIVYAIQEAGLQATRDAIEFQPPGVLVGAPTFAGAATMQSIALIVPVRVVVTEPGQAGLEGLLTAVCLLQPVLGEKGGEPTTYASPINPNGLPAYLIQVHVNVSTLEE